MFLVYLCDLYLKGAKKIIMISTKVLVPVLLCCKLSACIVSAQLTTLGLVLGSAVLGEASWFSWDSVKDVTYCRISECCNSRYVPYNLTRLQISLSQRMYGQPLVNELVNILKAHKKALNEDSEIRNKKSLVISLHGWSGVGKNYATYMIAEAMFREGMKSKYVKLFMGKKDFPCYNLDEVKKKLFTQINEVVKQCKHALIIFDEIHDMCPTVLDTIKPMLDHHHQVDGVDFRDAIFIFISNIGGNEIANRLLELYDEGYIRENVDFHNFEPIIRRVSFYSGGFEKSSTIAQHLIDHYIPFLPLEQRHVEMCARRDFRLRGIDDPTEEMMAAALSIITYGPREDRPIFANNGCKRFTKHIPYIIQKYNVSNKHEEL